MIEFHAGRRIWDSVPDFTATDAVSAAISYVGADADRLVWLGQGDRLVFDGSDASLRAGLANPDVLQRWTHAGVELRSLPGLHAKVLLVSSADDARAFVGSMNLSHHSNDSLEEALVTLDGAAEVAAIDAWIEGLLARGEPVTSAWLKRARALYRPARGPKPRASGHELLNLSGRTWLTYIEETDGQFGPETSRAVVDEQGMTGSLLVEAVDTTDAALSQVGDVWLVAFPGVVTPSGGVSGNTRVRGLCVVRRVIRERGSRSDVVVWAPPEQLANPQRLTTVRAHLNLDVGTTTHLVPKKLVPSLYRLLGVSRP